MVVKGSETNWVYLVLDEWEVSSTSVKTVGLLVYQILENSSCSDVSPSPGEMIKSDIFCSCVLNLVEKMTTHT